MFAADPARLRGWFLSKHEDKRAFTKSTLNRAMSQTIAEKIFSSHCGQAAHAGETVVACLLIEAAGIRVIIVKS